MHVTVHNFFILKNTIHRINTVNSIGVKSGCKNRITRRSSIILELWSTSANQDTLQSTPINNYGRSQILHCSEIMFKSDLYIVILLILQFV